MSNIAYNVSDLSMPQKLIKGPEIISMSTNNPDVPGNATPLAAFSAAQTNLATAHAEYEESRRNCKQLLAVREASLEVWLSSLTGLGSFTESVTGGDAAKILSAGFDVKAPPSPPQPVAQILNVRVAFNGEPGKSVLTWKRDRNADAYVIQCTQDPTGETGWVYLATTPEAKFTGNGAIPGKPCWYRVAAVNRLGQGPWSEPALRPVV